MINKILEAFDSKVTKIAAFLAALVGITTFFVNLYTQQLHNEIEMCNKSLTVCEKNKYNQSIVVNGKDVPFEEIINEAEYLRFLADYNDAVGKYQQSRSQENQETMLMATNNLANYIIAKRQNFIQGSKDAHAAVIIISDDKMRFQLKDYYIPNAVSLMVKNPKAYGL
jgi:hypothetical protein